MVAVTEDIAAADTGMAGIAAADTVTADIAADGTAGMAAETTGVRLLLAASSGGSSEEPWQLRITLHTRIPNLTLRVTIMTELLPGEHRATDCVFFAAAADLQNYGFAAF
jgi:hypothetical protein